MAGLLSIAAATLAATPASAQDSGWPRQFDTPSGSFVIYQPQPDDLRGDLLTGRAAFSLQGGSDSYPVFGVLWFSERIQVDRDSSTVTARDFDVTRVRLPHIQPDQAAQYEKLVEDEATSWDLSVSLEDLQAGLAAAEKERANVAGIDNTPPKIVFHVGRAILVLYDGAPALEPLDNSPLQYVANTPYAVVFDPQSKTYYLNGANLWYQASDPMGPWAGIEGPPAAVRAVVRPDTSSYDQVTGERPEILTSVEPTELIVTSGPPQYAPLVEDELLYLVNTESDVLRDVRTQLLYVLLSGRWFRAPSMDGPWTFVRGDQLPASFKRVPPDSPKGNILASVTGTDEADDAVADAQIPQTSAIRRDDGTFSASWDGPPQFAPIEGTDLQYAMNSDTQIILADGRYYACDQGVWYVSDFPDGPWRVSETRPLGVENIPPSCPVYDVRYVYVYDSTPDVVYVGYLPGYLGCYPYYGTVYYGTGYQYRPWRTRHHFIPRRFTWGFHARYNPWLSRWSFGYTYSAAFLRTGTGSRIRATVATGKAGSSAWFGPGGYRRPLVGKDLTMVRTRSSTRVRPAVPDRLPSNVYSRTENVARVDLSAVKTAIRTVPRPVVRPAPVRNDVFAGKDGRVYRRDDKGDWQVRERTAWKGTKLPPPEPPPSGTREPARPPTVKPRPPEVRQPETRPDPEVRPKPQPELKPQPEVRPTPQPELKPQPDARPKPEPHVTERPAPPRDNPPGSNAPPPSARPTPPPPSHAPGDLEREFRARQRSEGDKKPGASSGS
ncbi:MAG: carbohydrate-binding family V/XII [Candidatus Eiseniibacteriota bacterium]